jgi:uncharacterized protein (TIGR03437 family)
MILTPAAQPQSSLLNTNLIVNGNAESGNVSDPSSQVPSIPGWTRNGTITVLSYGDTGYLQTTDPAPPDHGFQYFYQVPNGGGAAQTLTQTIDVSSANSLISNGNVKFAASAYLGGTAGLTTSAKSQVTMAFQNAKGQAFSSVSLGPLNAFSGLYFQQSIGVVPAGTVMITVTLSFAGGSGAADSLSLVLTQLGGTTAGSVLGTNLVANPGAESGPSAPTTAIAAYVPGWATMYGFSVAPYGGTNFVQATSPSPVDRGTKLFYGETGITSVGYQELDVSPASALIDASQITYQVSAWLGSINGNRSPAMLYSFYDWSGNQLGTSSQLGPVNPPATGLVEASSSGTLPAGTRRVHVELNCNGNFADNVSFILSAPNGPPVIDPGGIVSASAFGGGQVVGQGSWVEIYGRNLASTTASWSASDFNNGVGPTALQGVSVSIGGQSAYVNYVSPGQIDALLPSNAMTGAAPIMVTNANGTSDPFYVAVNATQPQLLAPGTFLIGGKQYVAAFNPDGTFALPQNALVGVSSNPATPGQTIVLYGIGFGPVSDGVTAGTLPTQQDSLTLPLVVTVGAANAQLAYAGLASGLTGLYQINFVVPQITANSAVPITFTLNGTKGTQTLYLAVN